MLLIGEVIQSKDALDFQVDGVVIKKSKPWDLLTVSAVCVEDREGEHFGDVHYSFKEMETEKYIPYFIASNKFIPIRYLTEKQIKDYKL